MKKLSQAETLALSGLLRMESDGLVVARVMRPLIGDETLQKQMDAAILAAEGRLQGLQQFIGENQVSTTEEVH